MTLPPGYLSRSFWNARRPTGIVTLLPSAVDGIVYHYTAARADIQESHLNCAGRVRGIQNFHMEGRGWADIAYNFLVCKHGYIFEGRGISRKSAATGAANSHTLAVCFLGDDSEGRDDVTSLGRQALVDVSRFIRQQRPLAKNLWGHRDFMATSCPGNEIYRYIHGATFLAQLNTDEKARLRRIILAWHADGYGWKWIKQQKEWLEFVRLGGR